MRKRRMIVALAGGLMLSAGVAAAAIPGPQRMLAPWAYGLTEIAGGVWTDDPDHAESHMRMVASANARVRAFFGELGRQPLTILCATMMCEKTFGARGRVAITYGWHAIRIPPRGLDDPALGAVLLAHERTHVELHRSWGWRISALWAPPQPNWFDEGLASFVSRDHRLPSNVGDEAKAWIRGSLNYRDWGRFVAARGWRAAYAAAAANVADLRARVGDQGLLDLIARTNAGEPFSVRAGIADGG